MKRLNIKLAVSLVLGLAVLVGGVHLLHAVQVDRNADGVFQQAQLLYEKGNLEEAYDFAQRYLHLREEDLRGSKLLADIAYDIAELPRATVKKKRRAFFEMERAVRLNPDDKQLRRKLLDYHVKFNSITAALAHVKLLRDSKHPDPELEIIAAKCYAVTGAYDDAAKICQMLVGYDPIENSFSDDAPGRNNVDAYVILADLYKERKVGSEAQADAIIERMIAINKDSAKAQLSAYGYWRRNHNADRAKQSLDVAFQLDPESPEVVLPIVEEAVEEKRLDDALKLVKTAIEKHPDEAMLYRALAQIELRQHKPAEGVKSVQRGLERLPESELLLSTLVEVQIENGDIANAKTTLQKLKDVEPSAPYFDFYEAHFLMREQKWQQAIDKLTKARGKLIFNPQVVAKINTLLGKCYQAQGEFELAEAAFRGITNKTTALTDADLGVAQVLVATGRNAEALQQYEAIANALGEQALEKDFVWRPLLQLRSWDQMRLPKEKRDWSKVEGLVDQLRQANKLDPISYVAIQGEVLVSKGDYDAARNLYTTALHDNIKSEVLWMARLNLELQASGPEEALRLSEQVPRDLQDGLVMRLVRASIFERIDGDDGKAGLLSVEKGMERLSANDQYKLLQGLVQKYRQRKDRESASRILGRMMEQWKNDLFSRSMAFDMAREDGDIKAMQRLVTEIRTVAGPQSPFPPVFDAVSRITAVSVAQKASVKPGQTQFELTSDQKSELQSARKILEQVAQENKTWNEPHKWLGDISPLENDGEGMLTELQTAAKLGPLEAGRTRQLYDLLVAKGLNSQAEEVYKRLGGDLKAGTAWSQVEIMIQGNRLDDVRKLLDTLEPKADADLAELLRYADVRRRINDFAAAESVLQRAVQLDPKSAKAWTLLVNSLANQRKMADAEAAIQRAKASIPAAERDLALAQCYEAMRDSKHAEQFYVKNASDKPQDLAANQFVASFYLRNNRYEEALKYLDLISAAAPNAKTPAEKDIISWSRRGRAVAVAYKANWQQFQEAEALLRENDAEVKKNGGEPTATDLSLRIALLADRPEPSSSREALKLFEQLQSRQPLQTNELVNMARLYERADQWPKAKEIMLSVISARDVDPLHYLAYAEMLLRNGELTDVEAWLNRYDRIGKDGASLPIRVKLRVRQGRPKEAIALVNNWIGPPQAWTAARSLQVQTAAQLLQDLAQYADAEKIWRQYAKIDPRATILLAKCVGMSGSLDEAFSLLETSTKHHPPKAVLLYGIEILRARKTNAQEKHFSKLGEWYAAARQADPSDVQIESIIGDMWEIRGDLDKAEAVYRKLLARNDLNPTFRAGIGNNLAFILSTQGKNTDEAVKLIEDAMKVYGPSSDLLDTRGIVYLAAGKPDKAATDFKEAVLVPSAMKWVHMAFAQHELKDDAGAVASLKKAQESDLKRQDLYDAEWVRYEKLARDLGVL